MPHRYHRYIDTVRRHRAEKDKIHKEYHRKMHELYKNDKDFTWFHKRIRYTRPLILPLTLLIWYLIFHYFGLKAIALIFAIPITLGGVGQLFFYLRLERRIFIPISQLKSGVEEISKGNYEVRVDCDSSEELRVLIGSFNKMAEKLQEGEKLKLTYEENRKDLIANISHDLKTPITSIQGYIETLSENRDIELDTRNKYYQVIYNNAAYINKLIDDLFLFSKLDMQKLDLKLENTNIKAFMEDLMEEFKFELEDYNIKFSYEDNLTEAPFVRIDSKRIHQVFKNIIGNAVKYGNEQDNRINVKLYIKDNSICMEIADNGPGIPGDKLPYIFDRFYRVDDARTKDLMSTGLGLSISKELVEAHGGSISVTSKENLGTSFTITLPIAN